MFATGSGAAAVAVLLVLSGQAARSSLSCACAPCPLEVPAAADPPCCGDPEPSESPDPCACVHLDAVEGLPTGDDAPIPSFTMGDEPPVHLGPGEIPIKAGLSAGGPDPPPDPVSRCLRTCCLRF